MKFTKLTIYFLAFIISFFAVVNSASAATNVYYSVGQNNTANLMTGTPTVTIASGVATFSTAQTGNIGVGDRVTYNTSDIAYISAKQSTTIWNLVSATGTTPANITGSTVVSIKREYASLSAAINAVTGAGDANHMATTTLTAAPAGGDFILNLPCYYDTGADTTAVTVDGYTTGADNYIKIYTPNNTSTEANTSQRHDGKWNTGKYRLETTAATPITVAEDYTQIIGLQVYLNVNANNYYGIYTGGTAEPTIAYNIVKSNPAFSGKTLYGIVANNASGTAYIYNNLVYDICANDLGSKGIQSLNAFGSHSRIYNNTVINTYHGIQGTNDNDTVAKNNLVYLCTIAMTGAGNYGAGTGYNATNNASLDYTVNGGSVGDRLSQTFTFLDEANDDFHLALSDTGAKDFGANLSADANLPFSTDIDGNGRSLWDIGADEGSTEFVATVMQSGGDFNTLSSWENAVDGSANTDLTASTTKVFSGSTTGSIANYATVTLYRSGVSQGITGVLIYDTLAGQALVGQISSPAFVFAANDEWRVDASNLFTISTAGGNPPIAVAKIDGAWTAADTTAVTIDGWTTDATHYIKIYTTTAARHDGKWNTGKYRLEVYANGIVAGEDYVKIEGIQFQTSFDVPGHRGGVVTDESYPLTLDNNWINISHSIFKGVPTGNTAIHGIYILWGSLANVKAWNNIFYDFLSVTPTGSGIDFGSGKTLYAYNNTAYNCYTGFNTSGGTSVAKNNLSYNNTDNYSTNWNGSSTNNLSGPTQTDAPGANSQQGKTLTFANTTAGSENFHLISTDTNAIGKGVDLNPDPDGYLTITDDIDGQTRPDGAGTWDIGADELNPSIEFVSSSSSGAESVTSVPITVYLTATTTLNASIDYAVTGTATGGGTDYILANGTATITAGNSTTTINAVIVDDSSKESSETIILTLSNPVNALNGTTTTHTYTILDNDNIAPEFQTGTSATQISDSGDANWGKMRIDYSIRDQDNSSVTPSFEYNLGAGWIAITAGYLNATALDAKSVDNTNYTTYTAYWDIKSQIPNTSTAAGQARVTVNDGESSNPTGSATVSSVSIDTTAPTLSTLTLDSSADTLTISATDSSNILYMASNNSDGSADGSNTTYNSWQTVGGTSTTTTIAWTYSPDSSNYESVTAVVKDIYGNTGTTTDTAPYAPVSFSYKDISNTAAEDYREFLSWDVYVASTTAAFGSYKIYRSTDNVTYALLVTNTPNSLNYHIDSTVASTTTYYFKAVVVDSDGDISSYTSSASDLPDGQGGTDTSAPIITAGPTVAETKSTWAQITWTTDEQSNSVVEYSAGSPTYTSTTTVNTMVVSHSVNVTGLTPNTLYYFRVKSADILTNSVTSSGSTFTTTEGPIISDTTVTNVTDTTASITWNTTTDSNSWVYYSTTASFTSSSTQGTNTLVGTSTNGYYQHNVNLANLSQKTTYYFFVKSTDASSDIAVDNNAGSYYTFTTAYDNQPPVISGITAAVRSSSALVITWNTDESATTQMYYGLTSSYGSNTTLDTTLSRNHAAALTGLAESTIYHFQARATDGSGNSAVSTDQTATTTAANEVLTVYVGGGGSVAPDIVDTKGPVISDITVTNIGAFSAVIGFKLSEMGTGFVDYGKDSNYGNTAGSDVFKTFHEIKLSGLKLGTEYHIKVSAMDKYGNKTESADQTFTTKFAAEAMEDLVTLENAEQFQEQLETLVESVMPSLVPPFVSNVKIDEITESSALVTWKTNIPALGSLLLSEDSKYGLAGSPQVGLASSSQYSTEIAENKGKIKDHELKITDLIPSTQYHIQAKSYVFPGAEGKSKDFTFFTKSAKTKPEIINVGNTEFTVAWRTDKETSSFVQYTNTNNKRKGQTGFEEKTSQHLVKAENLVPGTLYEVRVYGYDKDNNLVEADPLTVRTKKDLTPPKILSININSAFVPYKTDQLQTVISWKTDEPANSIVYFEEGVGISTDLKNKAGQENEYVLDHSVVISNFKPATIYRIKIISSDEVGNKTESPVRTVLAPRASESVFEIITKNLEDAFGFLKEIGK